MGTFKEEFINPVGSSWPVLNPSDITYVTGASSMDEDIKGEPSNSDISYFKGTSIDLGIIHQKDEQISEGPHKAFIIKENELGFYVETFVLSFQAIEKLKIFPLKSEALDYLKNFADTRNLCQGVKEELVFKNVSNLFPGSFSIEKQDRGFVYRSRACNLVAEDANKQRCGECINIFNTVGDEPGEVNINHYYEIDTEEVDNGIKKDPSECLKVDIKAEAHDVDDSINENDLENYHFEVEKDKKPAIKHPCNQCDAVFNTNKTLYRHKERCHSAKSEEKEDVENGAQHREGCKYSCDQCLAVFRYKRVFHRHMKQCHSIDVPLPKKGTVRFKSLQCPHCEKAFSATLSYNKHLRDVHGEDVYVPEKRIMKKCPSCEQEFNVSKSSYKLVCHLRLIHHDEDLSAVIEELELGDEGRVVCQICGETKRNKYILASHIKTIHEESEELVPCHICGKLLRQNYGSMYSHLRSHTTGDTPCKYCGQIFKNRIAARNHQKSHEPDFKKIECKVCGVKFSRMIHLKKHSRYVHLKIKEAKCDICGKLFSTKSKMMIHRNSVHSQEKQFACEFCQYRSARKDNLQAHRRKTHGVDDKNSRGGHPPQMPEIPFYLKNANSERSETPQMREDLPTFLKDANLDKIETPLSHHMGEMPSYMKDQSSDKSKISQNSERSETPQMGEDLPTANSDKSENPHHRNAHLMMREVPSYLKDQNSTKVETRHNMGEMPSYMKDQSSDKSKISQIPATMREMPTYFKDHMGDHPTYSKPPSLDKSESRQMPGIIRELPTYFKDQNYDKNVASHSPEIGSAHSPEMREFSGYMKDHSSSNSQAQQMPAMMEEMRKTSQMPAIMEEMRKTQQMPTMMEEMRKTQQMPAMMEEMRNYLKNHYQ